jgi:hypothetical protein
MREVVTTILDVIGLLLVATGVAWILWQWIGPAALVVAGLIVWAGTVIASRPGARS